MAAKWRTSGAWIVLAGATVVYLFAVGAPRQQVAAPLSTPELIVSLPRFAQVLLAGGDRYLAANLANFRVLVASTERMGPEDYLVQARLQQDIAWLNPAHEDNYYVAAAILPWSGQHPAAQKILQRAADARPFDWQPLFYYGFGRYHFDRDPGAGAEALQVAAQRATDQSDQWALARLAAIWAEHGYHADAAARVVQGMADNAPPGAFRKYLAKRSQRLLDLSRLEKAAEEFRLRTGRPPARLEDLVGAGLLVRLPVDPLGYGFGLDAAGNPVLLSNPQGYRR